MWKLSRIVVALTLVLSSLDVAAKLPVARMMEPEGTVEYALKDGSWKPAPRIKYLFEGYRVRTGKDGRVRIVNQTESTVQLLRKNSEIEITENSVVVVRGEISEPRSESASVWQSLLNKFQLAQKYTTVRRSAPTCNSKVITVDMVISTEFPDLVWRNACPEYHYQLVVSRLSDKEKEEQTESVVINIEVPRQASVEMIRYPLHDLSPGRYAYRVEVSDVDGTIFRPRRSSSLIVMDRQALESLSESLAGAGEDTFARAGLLSERGLLVAAMDEWRGYFSLYPNEVDMRPLLAESYARLRLENLRQREARLYQSQQYEE